MQEKGCIRFQDAVKESIALIKENGRADGTGRQCLSASQESEGRRQGGQVRAHVWPTLKPLIFEGFIVFCRDMRVFGCVN